MFYAQMVTQFLQMPMTTIRADLHCAVSRQRTVFLLLVHPRFRGYYTELWEELFASMQRQDLRVIFLGAGGDHLFGGNVFGYPDLFVRGRWIQLAYQIRTQLSYSEMTLYQILRTMLILPVLASYIPLRRFRLRRPVPWLQVQHTALYRELFAQPIGTCHMLPGRRARLDLLRSLQLHRDIENMQLWASTYGVGPRYPLADHRINRIRGALAN